MKIVIQDDRKVADIKEEFNTLFPYLKIEFFNKPHKTGMGSEKKKMIRPNGKTLQECRTIHNEGMLIIMPEMTVAELEESLSSVFGLSVQVFRRSGNVWLETTVTDSWTLEMQNNQGEILTKYMDERRTDREDVDEKDIN